MGIKCTAILPTLGMPRNQNQARSSERPEQPKYSNDTGYKTLPKALRTQALTALTSNFGLVGLVRWVWLGRFGLVGLVW